MEFVWYSHPTGFTLWKRWETEQRLEKERPVYIQQQQAQWLTEEVRTTGSFEEEPLRDMFLECLNALKLEIDASEDGREDDAAKAASARKEIHGDLEFREKKIVGELMQYFARSDLEPAHEMYDLLKYAVDNSEVDLDGDIE